MALRGYRACSVTILTSPLIYFSLISSSDWFVVLSSSSSVNRSSSLGEQIHGHLLQRARGPVDRLIQCIRPVALSTALCLSITKCDFLISLSMCVTTLFYCAIVPNKCQQDSCVKHGLKCSKSERGTKPHFRKRYASKKVRRPWKNEETT